MPNITLTTLQGLEQRGEKIVILTCHDATFAQTAARISVTWTYQVFAFVAQPSRLPRVNTRSPSSTSPAACAGNT